MYLHFKKFLFGFVIILLALQSGYSEETEMECLTTDTHQEGFLIRSSSYYQTDADGHKTLYRKERFFFDEREDSPRLMSHVLENAEGEVEKCHCFFYEDGMLKQEMLVGNLSGSCSVPCLIDDQGYPLMNGIETYCKTYEYLENDPSLITSIKEDNGWVTLYRYDAHGQCIAKLQGTEKEWVLRHFYAYDEAGNIQDMVFDDGKGNDKEDLQGMTQRQIIRHTFASDNTSQGKPLQTEIFCWDIQTKQETLVERIHFLYSNKGDLIQQLSENERGEIGYYFDFSSCEPSTHWSDLSSFFESSSSSFLHRAYESLATFFDYLKNSLKRAKEHLNCDLHIPSSVKHEIDEVGKTVLGDSMYMLMGPYEAKTDVGCYGKGEISDKVRISFINGILNTQEMIKESLEYISAAHGGNNVHYVYPPSQGWTLDLSRAIAVKVASHFGFVSTHSQLLAKLWKDLIAEMGGVDGGGVIIHYAHSLGGTETDRARDLLTPEEQKMIRVITIGSATIIRNKGFQSVTNMVSVNDGVSSVLLDPVGHIHNYFNPESNVIFHSSFLTASPVWPIDHLMNGPTYGPILKDLGQKFLDEFKLIEEKIEEEIEEIVGD